MKLSCVFALGDGSRVRFWEDTWCGENPLSDIFLALCSMKSQKGQRLLKSRAILEVRGLTIARWVKSRILCC